jgi:hypothetical protein
MTDQPPEPPPEPTPAPAPAPAPAQSNGAPAVTQGDLERTVQQAVARALNMVPVAGLALRGAGTGGAGGAGGPPTVSLLMGLTPKLGLKLPAMDDPALVTDLNDNFVILDDVVTASQVATLYNKTLVDAILIHPHVGGDQWEYANHTHLGPDSGGTLDGAAIVSGTIGTGNLIREGALQADLEDPIFHDSAFFAPKPTTAPYDTILRRTAAGVLQATRTAAGATYLAVKALGSSGSAWLGQAVVSAVPRLDLTANAFYDGTTWRTENTGQPGALLGMFPTTDTNSTLLGLWDVASDAGSPVNKLTLSRAGNLTLASNGTALGGTWQAGSPGGQYTNWNYWGAQHFGGGDFTIHNTTGSVIVNPSSAYMYPVNNTVNNGHPGARWAAVWVTNTVDVQGSGGGVRLYSREDFNQYQEAYVSGGTWRLYHNQTGDRIQVSRDGDTTVTRNLQVNGSANVQGNITTPGGIIWAQGNVVRAQGGGQYLDHTGHGLEANYGDIFIRSNGGLGPIWIYPSQSGFLPGVDTGPGCGMSGNRWLEGWGLRGWTTTSTEDVKGEIVPLDPVACLQACRDVAWFSFLYAQPARTPLRRDATKAEAEDHERAYQRYVSDTEGTRAQRGYVFPSLISNPPSELPPVPPLFGNENRVSGQAQADLATVGCGLQELLRQFDALTARVAALEAA